MAHRRGPYHYLARLVLAIVLSLGLWALAIIMIIGFGAGVRL